jgi:BirA family biotin operon repressor/biotin-[acetyl-CoA-carboxylase] ligase
MSFILHADQLGFDNPTAITAYAAVCVCEAIEALCNLSPAIKWVNDIFLGKKVCGILTEATFGMESGLVESAVLGIGVNITRPENGFPRALEGIATAVADRSFGKDGERCRLIAAIIDNFWEFYKELPARKFLDEYRERSIVLGEDISVLSNLGERTARAIAIDDACRLVVRYENGETEPLGSGEVRIKSVDS